ncbi:MAG TPA: hypothetical protein VFK94_03275, partial [Patescibacteria group bacterium]|nr:hypothetical protein [Patescibacteria group bacterium]
MGKDLPVLPLGAAGQPSEQLESFLYSRVFCQKENSPPLRLLIDFLKSRGQSPIVPPNLEEGALEDWAWVHVSLGYHQERKPVHVFCVRDRGSYRDVYEQEKKLFLDFLTAHSGIE